MYAHQLRSGKSYKAVVTQQINTMASSQSSSPASTPALSSATAPTIKLLHQEPSLKRFSGDDPSHSPLVFLQQCEDCMRGSSITQDVDKISFIRSQLVQDSLATLMMRANSFNTDLIGCSYAKFKENFLNTFGTSQDDASLQWSFRLADSLTKNLGNLGILKGQAYAADFANEAISALQSGNWSEDGKISLERLRTVFEFQCYIMYLTPQERRLASTLKFKPDQSLLDFASKLSKRVQEAPKAPTVPVAPVQVNTNTDVSPHSSSITSSTSGSHQVTHTPHTCTFCGKTGHRFIHCYQRKKKEAKTAKRLASPPVTSTTSVSHAQPSSQYYVAPSRSTRTHGVSNALMSHLAPPRAPPKWCHIHGYSNHITDDCFTILRLKHNQVATAGLHKPSGEASRPASTHPT